MTFHYCEEHGLIKKLFSEVREGIDYTTFTSLEEDENDRTTFDLIEGEFRKAILADVINDTVDKLNKAAGKAFDDLEISLIDEDLIIVFFFNGKNRTSLNISQSKPHEITCFTELYDYYSGSAISPEMPNVDPKAGMIKSKFSNAIASLVTN